MPTINIYSHEKILNSELLQNLKELTTQLLSCKDIKLNTNEVSIRLIETKDIYMIAEIEIEIKAHNFLERVENQDKICNEVRTYLMKNLPEIKDIRVWLILSELGHSW